MAPPSRTVLMTARKPISQASLRRSAGSCMKTMSLRVPGIGTRDPGDQPPEPRFPGPGASRLSELANQVEDRQIHSDDDAADDDAEHGDHHRFEQRQESGN